MEEKLKLYLKTMISNKGSDLHLKSGSQVRVRIHGTLKVLGNVKGKKVLRRGWIGDTAVGA